MLFVLFHECDVCFEDNMTTLLGKQEPAAAGGSTTGVGGIYGTPQRDMVGYGSNAPDPKWPGGVSCPITCRHKYNPAIRIARIRSLFNMGYHPA